RIRWRLGPAKICAEVEKVVLDAPEHVPGVTLDMQPCHPHRGIRLVDRATGLDPQIVLGDAAPVAEAGAPLVAAARIDPRQKDHGVRTRRVRAPGRRLPTPGTARAAASAGCPSGG